MFPSDWGSCTPEAIGTPVCIEGSLTTSTNIHVGSEMYPCSSLLSLNAPPILPVVKGARKLTGKSICAPGSRVSTLACAKDNVSPSEHTSSVRGHGCWPTFLNRQIMKISSPGANFLCDRVFPKP